MEISNFEGKEEVTTIFRLAFDQVAWFDENSTTRPSAKNQPIWFIRYGETFGNGYGTGIYEENDIQSAWPGWSRVIEVDVGLIFQSAYLFGVMTIQPIAFLVFVLRNLSLRKIWMGEK